MTDNIKFPPLPVSANFYGMYGEYTKSQVEALMREAVRLNAQAVPCDCTTEIHADGTRKTWCGSDQMRRATEEGHAFAAAPAAPQPAQAEQTDARDAARWRYIAWHIGVAWNEQGFTSLVRIVSDKHREMLGDMVDRMMAGDWPEAAPQPAQQPLTDEKDALLRQALDALEGFANITNDSQGVKGYHLNGDIAEWDEFDEVDAANSTIEAIRNHLGVKND